MAFKRPTRQKKGRARRTPLPISPQPLQPPYTKAITMTPHAKNAPYSLTTEHGRAQSHAHSAHGAFLAASVETAMLTHAEEISEELCTLMTKGMADVNINCATDHTLFHQLTEFNNELGVRDKQVFTPLVLAYAEEHKEVIENFQRLIKLIREIQTMFGIDEEA